MQNIYKELKKNKYIILDKEKIDIESTKKLSKYFKGYNKVISTIMMKYFELPNWPTLILFDPTDYNVKEAIEQFSKQTNSFFVRSDTFENKIDNLNFRDAKREDLYTDILKIKEYENRWVVVIATPDIKGQEYLNDANCRTGLINGEIIQEWTGTGFSEYHLGKDKFPHKSALHAAVKLTKNGNFKKMFQISSKKYLEDKNTLLIAYGLESLKLKKQFLNKNFFKELTGFEFSGKEPTNDEMLLAYEKWLGKNKYTLKDLVSLGRKKLKSSDVLPKVLESKQWILNKSYISKVFKYYDTFNKKCKKLGINPEGKILTCSINKYSNKDGIIFWDIFNLFK